MSYRELIDALNSECDEKIRCIRQEADADAGKFREEVLKRVCELKDLYGREQSSAVRTETAAILAKARDTARTERLDAEKKLSDRLYLTAVRSLGRLRDEQYQDVLSSLIHELPPGLWEVVKVNPEDREFVRGFFPDAEIVDASSGVAGGLEVSGRNGTVRIVNTFEKRLERAWPEMLPEIMKDVYRSLSK